MDDPPLTPPYGSPTRLSEMHAHGAQDALKTRAQGGVKEGRRGRRPEQNRDWTQTFQGYDRSSGLRGGTKQDPSRTTTHSSGTIPEFASL